MLVLLVAVGQMAQTILFQLLPIWRAISTFVKGRCRRNGRLSADLRCLTAVLWPDFDRVGRRPVILVGMSIFMLASWSRSRPPV